MTIHTNIQGVFRLTSPMHVATTDTWGLNDEDKPVPYKTKKNLAATMTQTILANGHRHKVPFFPSNDIRGRLRRKAAAIVMESLNLRRITVPVDLYSGLTCGAANGNPENALTVEEAVRGASHVYMGLFGGGCRMLKARFITNDIVPAIQSTVEAGFVPESFGPWSHESLPVSIAFTKNEKGDSVPNQVPLRNGLELTDIRHIVRVDDVNRVLRLDELQKYVSNCAEAVATHQSLVSENQTKVKEGKESTDKNAEKTTKSTIANLASVQNIIPGTNMYVRLDLSDTLTNAQIGLLISSLLAIVNEQGLGGYARLGYGKFEALDFALTVEGKVISLFDKNNKGMYVLTPGVDEYLEAMREELAVETAESLRAFFVPMAAATGKKPKAEKAAQKGDAAAESAE